MEFLVHGILFLVSAAIIWFFSGILLTSTDRVAHRFNRRGFIVAFFVLGFLTSISEISVAVNSAIDGVPEISVGNLVGASFVLLLFIIPLLAVWGRGVPIRHTLSKQDFRLALVVILLPVLFVMDGGVSRTEGFITLLVYATLIFLVTREKDVVKREVTAVGENIPKDNGVWEWTRIVIGAIFIFIAGHFLVQEAVYLADWLSVPRSIVALLLLSIGTNLPELVIAVRSILQKHQDVAFGDYIGSAATNTFIFGILAVTQGPFLVDARGFTATAVLFSIGLLFFYVFAQSKRRISPIEGFALLFVYVCFVCAQIYYLARLGG